MKVLFLISSPGRGHSRCAEAIDIALRRQVGGIETETVDIHSIVDARVSAAIKDGYLRITGRLKDIIITAGGKNITPAEIENKLKFFPNIKEAVAFGDGRDACTVFLNIDLTAVGNWAERNNLSYASYQELAQHPRVYAMMEEHVAQVNRDLAGEETMAGSQIARFLVLHKELDADDGELTRTQKVRRSFIAERYAPLIEALYDGSTEKYVETEVIFEDGRKGKITATVEIRDMDRKPAAPAQKEAAE